MSEQAGEAQFIELVTDIVGAYVSNNTVPVAELPGLISQVHGALRQAAGGQPQPVEEPLKPAVPIKKSVTPDFIISLEDGKRYKSLKRHLRTKYDMTPDEYRAKWGLPKDYPMVAPNYASARSDLARKMGLGQKRRGTGSPKDAAPAAKQTASGRGRKKAATA